MYKAVFFDLDDTLVKSHLNFSKMRSDLGIDQGKDIIEELHKIDCVDKQKKYMDIIHEHEIIGAEKSEPMPGALDLVKYLHTNDIKTGILTRNSSFCANLMLKMHEIEVSPIYTRDNSLAKPHPDGLLKLSAHYDLKTEECLYIGDSHMDMEAAQNANMKGVFLDLKKYAENVEIFAT